MPRYIRPRLGTMMFIQYMGMGVVIPMIGHYLKGYLLFDPYHVGIILSMPAIAAFLSPLLVVHVADRWVSAERLLAVLHFLASGALVFAWAQTTFWTFLFAYFLYWLVFSPTLAMTNTVAFHHLSDARRDFGPVRVWGTIAWVMVGFLFGLLWLRQGGADPEANRLPHIFLFSAASSAAMGAYALTLPATGLQPRAGLRLSPWAAVAVFRRRSLLVLGAVTLANAILNMFYGIWMSPYLSQLGFSDGWILPLLSVGQISEIAIIGWLGYLMARVSLKGTLLIGLLAQTIRFIVFAFNPATPLLIVAIGLHGVTYGYFFVVAMIYVDNHCERGTRAGAQLLLGTVVGGFGNLIGSLTAGMAAQSLTIAGTRLVDYQWFWSIPAAACAVLTVVFAAGFREE